MIIKQDFEFSITYQVIVIAPATKKRNPKMIINFAKSLI